MWILYLFNDLFVHGCHTQRIHTNNVRIVVRIDVRIQWIRTCIRTSMCEPLCESMCGSSGFPHGFAHVFLQLKSTCIRHCRFQRQKHVPNVRPRFLF